MPTDAKKLSDKSQEFEDTTLDSLDAVASAIDVHNLFQEFSVKVTRDGVVSINQGDITNIFIDYSVWSNSEKFSQFKNDKGAEILFTCVGTHEEVEDSSSQLDEALLPSLAFPINISGLFRYLKSQFSLQERLYKTELVRTEVEETNESIKYVLRVSRELNGVRDTSKLLNLILTKAREIVNADAGSIYVVDWDEDSANGSINFKITQNETVKLNLSEFKIPISDSSIVGNATIHETSINIPDLYELSADRSQNPFGAQHDRSWDDRIGYQCRSMLTVPMFDISNRVIGVIQLINRRKKTVANLKNLTDFSDSVVPFDENSIEYAEIIAHQAGIALENALLTEERELLFDGFVHASVTAIEQRDPTTSGHSHRVAKLTTATALLLNRVSDGPFKDLVFNEDQLKEIEYASLLHDFGKLGVREEVLVKAKKLYPLEMELLLERFDHVRSQYQLEYANEVIEYLENPGKFPPGFGRGALQANRDRKLQELDDYLSFVIKCNEPTVLEQGGFERLKDIASVRYSSTRREDSMLLNDSELKALSVSRGSLTREEFTEIQSHVTHTYQFLRKIPWGKFGNVPQIAAKHHEKLDGSGYPSAASGDEIPIQSRIMTIADIFDALTASDRPYKKAVPTPKALSIIEMEVNAGKVDKSLFEIFHQSKIYESVLESSSN